MIQHIGIRGPEEQLSLIEQYLAQQGFKKATTYGIEPGGILSVTKDTYPVVIIGSDEYKSGDLGRAAEDSYIGKLIERWYELPEDWYKVICLTPEDVKYKWGRGDLVVIKEESRDKYEDYDGSVRCVRRIEGYGIGDLPFELGPEPKSCVDSDDLREPTLFELTKEAGDVGRSALEEIVKEKIAE